MRISDQPTSLFISDLGRDFQPAALRDSGGASTLAVGEESGSDSTMTTLAVGEESGSDSTMTSLAVGEESGSDSTMTSLAVGEESGSDSTMTTLAVGEESGCCDSGVGSGPTSLEQLLQLFIRDFGR
jgi:hypothetical protein